MRSIALWDGDRPYQFEGDGDLRVSTGELIGVLAPLIEIDFGSIPIHTGHRATFCISHLAYVEYHGTRTY